MNTMNQNSCSNDQHCANETNCNSSLEPASRFNTAHVDDTNDNDGRNSNDQFTAIYSPASNFIEWPGLQWPRNQITGNQTNGCTVHRNQCPICDGNKPPAKEGMSFTKSCVGIYEFTAGYRVFADEITITETDNDDHRSPENQTDGGTDRTSIWQKLVTWHNEAAPTNHGAKSKPPYA